MNLFSSGFLCVVQYSTSCTAVNINNYEHPSAFGRQVLRLLFWLSCSFSLCPPVQEDLPPVYRKHELVPEDKEATLLINNTRVPVLVSTTLSSFLWSKKITQWLDFTVTTKFVFKGKKNPASILKGTKTKLFIGTCIVLYSASSLANAPYIFIFTIWIFQFY